MRLPLAHAVVGLGLLATLPVSAPGQRHAAPTDAVTAHEGPWDGSAGASAVVPGRGTISRFPAPPDVLTTPGGAFAASLVVPGAGQAALGLKRWMVYGALEASFWALGLAAAADVRRLSGRYRDLAWEEARLPTAPGPRQDGRWSYYETMSRYLESGAYDTESLAGLQPESDPATYNGTVWELARELFLPGGTGDPGTPGYEDALDYYRERAAGPDFLWSWTGRPDALTRFRDLIHDADARARLRTTAAGLVLANHMVAAVDAYLAARTAAPVRLSTRLHAGPAGTLRWSVGLRIPIADHGTHR